MDEQKLDAGALGSTDGLGVVSLPVLDGREISPAVWLVGEPTPIPGTDKLRCLASVQDCLCLVELKMRFTTPNVEVSR